MKTYLYAVVDSKGNQYGQKFRLKVNAKKELKKQEEIQLRDDLMLDRIEDE